ncbi:MAG: bifunctional diaminohydroxyphosphoribosylaminopyrimidine deaminase/5-amino-6-(5-phosphoribosylamino)uracil reductase RibD [Alphaproteobacteria bacterium]|jgi:diaminohydroxyphosphoribosylaminopyrimidine deaminase/5-amino-6-(5-phosphoribosylamino)uracil reductase|nr:bifunctional diaminohydroxyphosphoribosylaminopyrimidine deaminase/5-amino-6-(5-phosphoribosylamino)uracil reductase RibD [Alphaproteobacteria bacterium]
MKQALSLARRGLGRVWPNPSVGCVIVQGGRVVGRARTADGGRPHAETQALAMAGAAARGATAYVTLEPCSHHGKTPPCTDALIAAGVGRVVVAAGDPDPRVAGTGIERLHAAGIEVRTGLLHDAAEADLAGYLLNRRGGRPLVTLKLASSFDGRIATATGESRWITGPLARRAVHAMRAHHDAVLVGAGTVRADDPALTVRGLGPIPQPVRIVASRRLDLPDGRLVATMDEAPLWLCHGDDAAPARRDAWQDRGARLVRCGVAQRQIDPADMLGRLGAAGLTSVFCEGGGAMAASLLSAGLVDEVVGFTAGVMLGAEGTPGLGAMGLEALAEAPRFDLVESRAIGSDLMHRWRVQRHSQD